MPTKKINSDCDVITISKAIADKKSNYIRNNKANARLLRKTVLRS